MKAFVSFIFAQMASQLSRWVDRRAAQYGGCPQGLRSGLWLWLSWTGLTWLAFVGSLALIEIGEKSDISITEGLIGGGVIGLAQGCALRWNSPTSREASQKGHLPRPFRWAIATVLSWGALTLFQIGALGWMVPQTHRLFLRSLAGIFYGAYVGLGLGIGQWLAIRQQVALAWRWIPLSSGIWALGMSLGWSIGGSLRAASNLFIGEVFGLVLAWSAIALLSGLAMVGLIYPQALPPKVQDRLSPQPKSSSPARPRP